ncbi:unnamed protein product [Urochloa humidicola]
MPTSESRTESMSLSPQAVAIFSKLLSWCRTFSTNKKAADRSWNRSDCEDATLVSATFRNIPWIRRRERIESAVSTKCFGRKKRKGPGSGHNWGPTVAGSCCPLFRYGGLCYQIMGCSCDLMVVVMSEYTVLDHGRCCLQVSYSR